MLKLLGNSIVKMLFEDGFPALAKINFLAWVMPGDSVKKKITGDSQNMYLLMINLNTEILHIQ